MKFDTGQTIYYCHKASPMSAPLGAPAIVMGYITQGYNRTYLLVKWIQREKFGNHMQNDGGYYEEIFELETLEELKRKFKIKEILTELGYAP